MEDKIKEEFMGEIHNKAEKMYQESLLEIESGFEKELENIAKTLLEVMIQGLENYQKLEEEGKTGALSYVFISFLRTGSLLNSSYYRLDFYDEKKRVSLVECAEAWNFNYIFDYLKDIKTELSKRFEKQTRVPGYELDYIVYDLAEKYKKLADKKIKSILHYILEQDGIRLFGSKSVKIYRGDLFDRVTLILQWEQEHIETQEEN